MNCYNHPDLPAVSSCIDCNKGLCIECSSRYTFPICVECIKIESLTNEAKSSKNSSLFLAEVQ